jgi:hypothetical protein|tara:strand:- start:107 stop:268 length:162 start_codon:yes stop_codon:yes gene_type:complete
MINLKSQVTKLQNLNINNNQATVEIKKKWIEISMLNNRIEIFKEELKNIKENC